MFWREGEYGPTNRFGDFFLNHTPQLFTQLDISAAAAPETMSGPALSPAVDEQVRLMREMVISQQRTCELLAELLSQVSQQQRQRNAELKAWKEANPDLAKSCREAAEALSSVHTEFLGSVAREAAENADSFTDSDYALGEFVDRYGPRLAHFNGVLQMLSQLGSPAVSPSSEA